MKDLQNFSYEEKKRHKNISCQARVFAKEEKSMVKYKGIYFSYNVIMAWETLGKNLTTLQTNPETVKTLTAVQLWELKGEVEACVPQNADACKDVLVWAINLADGDTKIELSRLLESLEKPEVAGYSLDALQVSIQDEKAKKFLEMYTFVIAKDLETIYGVDYSTLSESGKETVKLVFWDTILAQMSLKGATNVAIWKISSMTDMVTSLFGNETEASESVLTANLKSKQGSLSTGSPELATDIENSIALVESLLGKQANNLKALFDLTATLHPEQKSQIFENPKIIKAVMETGEYKDDNFNISLKDNTLEVGELPPEDISAIQTEFFSWLQATSGNMGKTLESLRQKASKAEWFLKQFWMEGEIDEIKASLFSIPIIGVFFKMILWDFFKEFDIADKLASVSSLVDKLPSSPEKTSLGHLGRFIESYKKDETISETPLKKFLTENGSFWSDFFTKVPEFLTKAKDKWVKIDDAAFWEKVLTGKNAGGAELQIYTALKGTLEAPDFSEESLQKALLGLPPETFTLQDTAQTLATAPVTGWSFEAQVLALTGLPATLTLETGEVFEIGVFDSATGRISINGRTFEFSNVLIAGVASPMKMKNIIFEATGPSLEIDVPLTWVKKVAVKSDILLKTLQELTATGSSTLAWEAWSLNITETK